MWWVRGVQPLRLPRTPVRPNRVVWQVLLGLLVLVVLGPPVLLVSVLLARVVLRVLVAVLV